MAVDDIEQDVVPTVEEPEEPETPEADEPEQPETPAEEPEENLEQIRKDAKAFKDQKARAEKAEKELKQLKNGGKDRVPKKDGQGLSQEDDERLVRAEDRAERAELRAMGVTHADDIQLVRDAAKRLGVDVADAADDEFVKTKLERQRATRKTKENTPPPSTKGGGPTPKKGKSAWDMSDEEFQKERARIMSGGN
jgi:hypothetical protein